MTEWKHKQKRDKITLVEFEDTYAEKADADANGKHQEHHHDEGKDRSSACQTEKNPPHDQPMNVKKWFERKTSIDTFFSPSRR